MAIGTEMESEFFLFGGWLKKVRGPSNVATLAIKYGSCNNGFICKLKYSL